MDDTPLEAGLMFTCKLKTDTDFLGRSALEQRRATQVTLIMILISSLTVSLIIILISTQITHHFTITV